MKAIFHGILLVVATCLAVAGAAGWPRACPLLAICFGFYVITED